MTEPIVKIILIVLVLNLLLTFTMIFTERKKPESIAAWLMVLTFMPIIGFLFYALMGGGLSFKTKRMLKQKRVYSKAYIANLETQANMLYNGDERIFSETASNYKDLVLLNMKNSESIFTKNNTVDIFLNGQDKFIKLKQDILNAKDHVHLLYFIFANDKTGKELCRLLTKKAKEGIKVKLLYDSFGSIRTKPKMLRDLKKAGAEILEFFPPLIGAKFVNFKANYRNHRKIVVIDGVIGYTGGINIRDDHMGLNKKLSPWRDTHIRVRGSAVHSLQNIFLSDWLSSNEFEFNKKEFENTKYFPKKYFPGTTGMQVISSGPESPEQQIKDALIKMINSAKKSIYIQTPYFIPDDSFMEALRLALLSDVEVHIMIPNKPDKKVVYYATLSHIKNILDLGAKIYLYNGFLHSKTLVIDEEIATIGTCNMDIRSFMLNFEVNAIIYCSKTAKQLHKIFVKDVGNSEIMSYNYYRGLSNFKKFLISIFRLFSPIL